MDLLAAYDSESSLDEPDADCTAAAESVGPAGEGAAAQQHQAESADQDHPPQSKRASLNTGAASSKALEASGTTAAGAGAAAAGTVAAALAEPERVRRFPLVEGLFPTVVYVPVHGAAAQQLHALAEALVAACAAANLTPRCDKHMNACGSGSQLVLWPMCSASVGSRMACSAALAERAAQPQQLQQQRHGQTGTEGTAGAHTLPLHMSLSQTVPIRYGQAASLRAASEKQLRPCRTFKMQLTGLVCLTNEPKTRSFVCIRVAAGLQQVLRMVGQMDKAFALHGLPEFYKDPIPHVSLAWTPGDQTAVLQQWLGSFAHSPVAMQVTQAVCQVGKVKHTVWEA